MSLFKRRFNEFKVTSPGLEGLKDANDMPVSEINASELTVTLPDGRVISITVSRDMKSLDIEYRASRTPNGASPVRISL